VVFTEAVARFQALAALEEFGLRLYGCLAARPDALFELADAVLCADHAVTSLVQLCLKPEFRRGHGALYDALAARRVDDERLFSPLAQVPPMSVPARPHQRLGIQRVELHRTTRILQLHRSRVPPVGPFSRERPAQKIARRSLPSATCSALCLHHCCHGESRGTRATLARWAPYLQVRRTRGAGWTANNPLRC
jgi:hypothetical protein